MALSRKHFEAIAAIVKRADAVGMGTADDKDMDWSVGYCSFFGQITEGLADYFEAENPAFDRERFLNACDQ